MRGVFTTWCAATLAALVVCAGGCTTFFYDLETEDGLTLQARRRISVLHRVKSQDVTLEVGVKADGTWYLRTGDAVSGVEPDPETAQALVNGFVAGLGRAAVIASRGF